MRLLAIAPTAVLVVSAVLHAQSFTTGPCPEEHHYGDRSRACEVRSATLPLVNGSIAVDGDNGGIQLIGEDRSDVFLEARVSTQAGSQGQADALLHEITLLTQDTVHAKAPDNLPSHASWAVEYKLHVPHRLNARLHTHNGGIHLENAEGTLSAETTNGGITVADLAGDVHLLTVNGGVTAKLAGSRWAGTGLVARTTNGGISVGTPDGYSAHLVAQTEHGGTSVEFPVTVRGSIGNHLDTNLGSGGPTLEFVTVNGGVSIHHS